MLDGMREVVRLAEARGVALGEADVAEWCRLLDGISPLGKTSMLQDIDAGRPTEIEMLCGKVLALGKELGVATPISGAYYRLIRAIEEAQRR